jgi:putative ABC transport system permease protein
MMETVLHDVRFALRVFRKSPLFTAVVVLTLALGIGANTAIFSMVNAVLLRSLPFREPDRLQKVTFNNPGVGLRDVPFSVPEFEDLRTRAGVFDEVSVVWPVSVNLTGAKEPQRLELLAVSPNYFSMLGATPQIGRLFGPEDFSIGFSTAAIISDGLWRRSYGADPNILGRNLRLDNDLYTIVGVLPPAFRHPGKTVARDVEVWGTAGYSADPFPKPARNVRLLPEAIARLKPGITVRQAQARLDIMASELRQEFSSDYPPLAKWSIAIQPLQQSLVGDVRLMMLVLMGTVVLIILIASVNIANLLLARASGRQQEIAMRLTLGASRSRMVRQLLTESLMLSLIGGVAGVAAASLTLGSILRFLPHGIPRLSEVRVDGVVLLFALLISVLTGLFFGLAPALQSTRPDVFAAIREGARGSGYSAKTNRLRGTLIVSELALAVVLMIGAGLLLRSFVGLLQANPGFNPSSVVAASIWLPVPNDPKADPYSGIAPQTIFVREAVRRLRAIPGVDLAGMTSALPASEQAFSTALSIEDQPVESSQDLRAEAIRVTPGFFEVLRTPLVRGRFFTEGDEDGKQPVAIIDETTARRYWGDRDPLGRRLRFAQIPNFPWLSIVGIVKDIKHDGLEVDGVPHIYVPMYQRPGRTVSIVLRTSLPASVLEPQIRREVQSVDPGLPLFNVRSMREVLDDSLAPRRFSSSLVGAFAAVALLLASLGIYGLLAYMVGQKSHEIGIRIALGAQPSDILGLILRRGMVLSSAGIFTGLLLAAVAAPAIASLLYGVHPIDPLVFLSVPAVFLVVAFLASSIPARRALRVDPIVALRDS